MPELFLLIDQIIYFLRDSIDWSKKFENLKAFVYFDIIRARLAQG